MPKVYLTEKERWNERVRTVIDEYIGRRRLIHRAGLARRLNMDKGKLYRRYEKPETFTLGELQGMFRNLNFTDEDILKVVKG